MEVTNNKKDLLSTPASETKNTNQLAVSTDQFLQLFIAQLQNQDPTDPMDSKDMVTNLAQINQVTTMNGIAESISGLLDATTQPSLSDLSALVDKDIEYLADTTNVADNTVNGRLAGYDGGEVSLAVMDAFGNRVDGVTLNNEGVFSWSRGALPEGQYTFVPEGEDVTGAEQVALTSSVNEVDIMNKELILDNGTSILYDNITKISKGRDA